MEEPNVPQTYPPVLPQSTLAIISLIAGIGGFTFLPLVGTVVIAFVPSSQERSIRALLITLGFREVRFVTTLPGPA